MDLTHTIIINLAITDTKIDRSITFTDQPKKIYNVLYLPSPKSLTNVITYFQLH